MKNEEGKTVWIKSGKPVGREKDPNTVHQPYVPTGRPRGRPKKDPSQLKSGFFFENEKKSKPIFQLQKNQ